MVRDEGCRVSFRLLFERWSKPIQRTCFRMTGRWQDAEDLVQQIFTRLYRNRSRYQVKAKFRTYLWQIAMNAIRDFGRRQKRVSIKEEAIQDGLRDRLDPIKTRQNEALQDHLHEEIQAALLQLPSHFREVVLLRHFENLKFKEIAELLEVPLGTVSSRMAKAMRSLQTILTENKDERYYEPLN